MAASLEYRAGGERPKKEIGLRCAPADGIVAARSAKREIRQSPFSGQLLKIYLSSL
jgi:hypothetical protein